MKRRGFLSMLGAATLAPALPAISAPAAAATYNRYTFGLAVFHARTRAHVSAAGIAYRLKVTTAQAEAMMMEMASKGMVTPVFGKPGTMRATSNILKGGVWDTAQVTKAANKRRALKRDTSAKDDSKRHGVSGNWLAHVRSLATDNGFVLSPRALKVTV